MINHHQTRIFFTLHNQILSWQASGKFVQKPILRTEFLFCSEDKRYDWYIVLHEFSDSKTYCFHAQ